MRNFIENENSLTIAATEKVQQWINNAHEKVFSVAPKFEKQLEYLIYHAELGLQVILEDYVSTLSLRILSFYVIRAFRIAVVLITIYSIFSITVGIN